MARLTWREPDGSTRCVTVDDAIVLGRDPEADCILSSRGVSRLHARVARGEEGWILEDLGSTNGTLLNGDRLESPVRLRSGDRIRLGKALLEFETETEFVDDSSGPEPTQPLPRTLEYERLAQAGLEGMRGDLPERLPRSFGKFQLLELLGQGGMGRVYRAEDQESGRIVALKLIRSHIGRRESFLEYFYNREAVLAREIEHQNVVRVYEHGVDHDQHWISMEDVRGESLSRVLRRGRLASAEVLEILRQVACGLAAAHRQGVVHSDIKPGNLILTERFRGKDGSSEVDEEDSGQILELDDTESAIEFARNRKHRDEGLEAEVRRRLGERSVPAVLDDPPYFHRASEMRFLEHYLERLGEGRGFFVLLGGERGVGKKRIVSEFVLARRDVTLIDDKDVAFYELDCARIEGIPLLYEQMAGQKSGVDFNLRQTVDDILRLTEASPRPMVVRILELGKASALVCYLIVSWARRMSREPILLVATLDPEEPRENDSVRSLIDMVKDVLKSLYLRPLTEYQIQRYLDMLFPGGAAREDLAANLYRLSNGNFARLFELLRSFFERGILKSDPDTSFVIYNPSPREIELEEGKNLYEKYRSYGRVEQQVLQAAAFIGQHFFFDALQRFSNLDETALFFILRQLLADGFLHEDARTWYRFTNNSFQHYIAERVPPPERPHLHRRVAQVLQSAPVRECAALYQLRGHHLDGCREFSKAVDAYLEGAHLARSNYESDAAREMYQEILRIYRELGRSEGPRREVNAVLRSWFRRDGNWYEILGELASRREEVIVKIADFGISFRTEDEERGYHLGKRPVMGTPRYIAPERAKGEQGGPKSDVFSLGIIAYEMAVGRPPFPELEKKRVARAYQTRPVRLPAAALSRFPAGFAALVEGMVQIDPQRRFDAERVVREIVKIQFDLATHRNGG